MYILTYTYTHIYTHTYIHILHIHAYKPIHVIEMCIYICNIHIYTYIHMHTHTHTRKESLLRCAVCTSNCVWLVCDLAVMCVQVVGDRALGDLCVCVRCGSVQSQKVCVCYNRVRHQCGSC